MLEIRNRLRQRVLRALLIAAGLAGTVAAGLCFTSASVRVAAVLPLMLFLLVLIGIVTYQGSRFPRELCVASDFLAASYASRRKRTIPWSEVRCVSFTAGEWMNVDIVTQSGTVSFYKLGASDAEWLALHHALCRFASERSVPVYGDLAYRLYWNRELGA